MKLVIMKTNKTLKRYKFSKTKRKGNKKRKHKIWKFKSMWASGNRFDFPHC